MVVCAVRYEPVSTPNSLLQGIIQGNERFPCVEGARRRCAAVVSYVIPYESEQGKLFEEQGNSLLETGNFLATNIFLEWVLPEGRGRLFSHEQEIRFGTARPKPIKSHSIGHMCRAPADPLEGSLLSGLASACPRLTGS